MASLSEQGKPIDPITLKDELGDDFKETGGPAYIHALTDGVPSSANVEYYAGIVKEKAALRRTIKAANRILAAAYDGDELAIAAASAALVATSTRPTLRVLSGTDLVIAEDVPPIHSAWPILARGTVAALVASPGAGKTALVLRMLTDLVLADLRVFVCALEGMGGLKRRLLALCGAFGLEDAHLDRMRFGDHLQLGDPSSVRDVIAAAGPVDVFVIDTFSRGLGDLDENSSNAVGAALNACVRIGRECGQAAVLVLHHTNRASSSERGSGAFRGGVDALAFLEDEGETRVLRVDKMRDGCTPAPRAFRLREVAEVGSFVLDDAHKVLPAGTESELSIKTQLVLKELRRAGQMKATEAAEALKGHVGRSTVYGALEALEKLGLARQDRGTWTASHRGSPEASNV